MDAQAEDLMGTDSWAEDREETEGIWGDAQDDKNGGDDETYDPAEDGGDDQDWE